MITATNAATEPPIIAGMLSSTESFPPTTTVEEDCPVGDDDGAGLDEVTLGPVK